ncbi:MAG TPA: hypothetical protein PKI49_12830 [Pseudomonadota bacterium]|jgi:hypothetical protein|nr:hypothetical protein [Pseudomonadota bacterium]HND13294.1 hypothetical protein [Pseudomonadota bacterium]HNI61317.1 hypothetical protein [Pseudomonadota bacterium]HNK46188.1 hypothetical protein [Pseudomonadota bacterium]HNN53171.1 hypothetical protein [Pseudomonadota bacterium]
MNFRNSAALAKTFRRRSVWLAGFLLCFVGLSGCVTLRPIPGTKIADTPLHRELLQRVEEYRIAMEQRDAGKLLSMAHPNYYEDSGTPSAQDDYAYAGLKRVLETRLSSVRWMRYLIRYRDIRVTGDRATVDLRYDLSFQLMTEIGEKWERRQNDKRLELVHEGDRWLFTSGF